MNLYLWIFLYRHYFSWNYIEIYNQKKQLFADTPICNSSNIQITYLEEADVYDGKLYHRAFSPKLLNGKNGSTKEKGVFCILLENEPIKFSKVKDALKYVVEYIAEKISNDSYDISRLTNLDYIGDRKALQSIQGEKHLIPLGELENNEGKQIYINIIGNKEETCEKIQTLASLFSFMSDFKILE